MYKSFFYSLLFFSILSFGQNDTIRLNNNDIIVGEVKSLTTGILTIETSYSDDDFTIEFNKVSELIIQKKSFIVLTHGRRRFGYIRTDTPGKVTITLEDGTEERYRLNEVIILQEVDDNFWRRFSASIDLGLDITKANNNTQFTIGGELNYTGKKWLYNGDISVLHSTQDDAEKIERTDAKIEILRILPKKWYLLGNISFLSSTEQALLGRESISLGPGRLLISTNKLSLGLASGLNYNIENFVDSSLDKTSTELFIFLSFKMFDFKNFDLNTGVNIYPSLSESKRIRMDYDIKLKYDLPLEFYIKLSFIFNFDNQPATEGNDIDYIFTSGFGWEFN